MKYGFKEIKLYAQDNELTIENILKVLFVLESSLTLVRIIASEKAAAVALLGVSWGLCDQVCFLRTGVSSMAVPDKCPFKGPNCREPEGSRRKHGPPSDGDLTSSEHNLFLMSEQPS